MVVRVGFEAKQARDVDGVSEGYDASSAPKEPDAPPKHVDPVPSGPASGPEDPVEGALARALDAAASGGRFDVVAQLARELEARRLARSGNVVAFAEGRRKREARRE